jgi:hypothetical protein
VNREDVVIKSKDDPLPESEPGKDKGRSGLKMLLYKSPPNGDQDDCMLEVLSQNGAILEHSIDYWCEHMYVMGNIPAYILAADKDRFYKYIFASIMVRRHANRDQKARAFRAMMDKEKMDQEKVKAEKEYDVNKHQQGLDPRVWDGSDDD